MNVKVTPNENAVWSLFYKGTALQMPFVYKQEIIDLYEGTIVTGLKYGVSIPQQKKNIIEDLDEMEQYICASFKDTEYTYKAFEDIIGKEQYLKLSKKWALNVICGLKLKLFANDNNHGFFFIDV